jgi:hypothetical protein
MTAQILQIATAAHSRPYAEHLSDGTDLCSYCMMLLQQLDVVRSGHEISITRRYSACSIKAAQKELAEKHGYPTTFHEGGGEHGFGYLVFQ